IIDAGMRELWETGFMHNRLRMITGSFLVKNLLIHWRFGKEWFWNCLVDADLASNSASWQWVAGAFSNKKYYANQENINTFFNSSQKNTFLDVEYSAFPDLEIPHELIPTQALDVDTILPKVPKPILENQKSTLIYNYYNLDPYWHKNDDVQRIFLLEPSFFKEHPISQKCLDFAIELSKNIEGMQLFVGEFAALQEMIDASCIVYKEHPTNCHYNGVEEPREWLSSVSGYFSSFFKFWKKCKKEL
ncbi:MAG: FAD-binding domain-containing protein, partial [Bacteroidia bacterium]|nr:FAD-binding domain-containing protein [Bacteroidia bacterium]